MNSRPNISDLPPSPPGKSGWPWTQASAPLPATLPNGNPWPKVSIVTPSFNQNWALEETLRSVIFQGYPNLEYIVMDDGSSDGSVETIRAYASWLSYWQTGPNQGQTQVLNQGFARATGQLFGWMNSDDLFLPNGIETLVRLWAMNPGYVGWVGATHEIDRNGCHIRCVKPVLRSKQEMFHWSPCGGKHTHFYQPACLFSGDAFLRVGGLDEFIWCGMDMDLWIRLRDIGDFCLTDRPVASARIYEQAKSFRLDERHMVDLVAMCYKQRSRDMALVLLSDYYRDMKQELCQHEAKQIKMLSVSDAMRCISNDDYLNHISVSELFSYLARRFGGKLRRLIHVAGRSSV